MEQGCGHAEYSEPLRGCQLCQTSRVIGGDRSKIRAGVGDGTADALPDQVFRELLTYLYDQIESTMVDRAIQLIPVSRHLEWIGDHVSNLAENAI